MITKSLMISLVAVAAALLVSAHTIERSQGTILASKVNGFHLVRY